MTKLSVIIPSADPRFLAQTVNSILQNAAGDVEIVAVLDGITLDTPLPDVVRVVALPERRGMRGAINAARPYVTGAWVMKCDEHVLFSEGFDEVLKADCADNWLLIPRRYSLDAEAWAVENNPKGPRDHHYLSCPIWSIRERDDYSMHGLEWPERTKAHLHTADVEETMSWQGSFYFMARRHWDWLGPLQQEGYGGFAGEPQEIGLKTWLGGGAIMVTKKCWGAHLHKGKRWQRGYRPNKAEISAGHEWGAHYWMTNKWRGRQHDLEWLIEKFWPVPGWPADILGDWGKYAPPGATLADLKAAALAKESV